MVVDELIEKLAECASQGRLALFLGTGFSKAVLGYLPFVPGHYSADLAARVPSWIELLSRCREELKLPSKEYHKGLAIDCPAEASEIVAELAKTIERVNAKRVFKATIAKIVDFYPNPEQVCAYQGLLKKIRPAVILTTNYDNVIETVLHNEYFPFGAKDVVCGLPAGMTAVYHLHGECGNPHEMVVTREDYVAALSPTSYRQKKLACIMREYAILYVGYSKCDINVLSAMDASDNTFLDLQDRERVAQVQLVYDTNASDGVFEEKELSRYSIHCNDTFAFLHRLADRCEKVFDERSNRIVSRREQYDKLLNLSVDESVRVVKERREGVANVIKGLAAEIAGGGIDSCSAKSMLIVLVQKLFEASRGESHKECNFDAYDDCLFILIELLVNMDVLGTQSFFFDFAVNKLEDIARYVGTGSGQSWAAEESLRKGWMRISDDVIAKVSDCATRYNLYGVSEIIGRMNRYHEQQKNSVSNDVEGWPV